jgi:hypothetical protein
MKDLIQETIDKVMSIIIWLIHLLIANIINLIDVLI